MLCGWYSRDYVHQQRSSDSYKNLDIYDKVMESKQDDQNWLRPRIHYLGTVDFKYNYI
jgi:hypothetical protein